MNFFLVFQNRTNREESQGGYLWAPQHNADGQTFFYWESMKKVKRGDVIFSSFKGKMKSMNIAISDCFEAQKPQNFDSGRAWIDKGWKVNAKYHTLVNPLKYKDYMDDILALQPDKYAPFHKNGGGNVGYLFEIGSELGQFLLSLAQSQGVRGIEQEDLQLLEQSSANNVIDHVEDSLPETLESTERDRIAKIRVGQGLFKRKLLRISNGCKLCGLKNSALLRASHSKPWKDSSNLERLDPYNGFLLCPQHDSLYDAGLISFTDEGGTLISGDIQPEEYALLNISPTTTIRIHENHKTYIAWHREHVFRN